jgi:hypothetical protein
LITRPSSAGQKSARAFHLKSRKAEKAVFCVLISVSRKKAFEKISWKDFFQVFDERKLAFLYQDKTADGKMSRFNKCVSKDK